MVYTEQAGAISRVVVDGVPGNDYDAIGTPRLSPRGNRVAYTARRGSYAMVVVDGKIGPEALRVGDPVFSPDGLHLAYRARASRDRAYVVVDGRKGPEFRLVVPNGPYYHPDGTLEYLAFRGSTLIRVRHVPRTP